MAIELEPRPAVTHRHDRFEVVVDGLGRYALDGSLPRGRGLKEDRYPIVLVVDGNLLFDVAQVVLHGGFAATASMLPPSIVVGVGYPADDGMATFQFAIRRWPSARIDWEIMNHEDHASIQLRAVAAGLRSVHRPRPGAHHREVEQARQAMLEAMAGKT